jgi:heme exporter protein D
VNPEDLLLIVAWIATLTGTSAMAWTPWRVTAGVQGIDLSDTVIGRAVSPLHIFVAPVVVLLAPLVAFAAAGTGPLAHRDALAASALIFLAALLVAQFVLRRALLKVAAQHRAKETRARAVLSRAGRRSARRFP